MIVLSVPYFNQDSIIDNPEPGVDWLEYRLDYCNQLNGIKLSRFSGNSILTIRDINEGGFINIEDLEKQEMIKQILSETRCLVDCEFLFLREYPHFTIEPERLVLSLHTDSCETKLIDDFLDTTIPAAHYKLAFKCEDINQIESIRRCIPEDKRQRISLIPLPPCSCSVRLYYRLYQSGFVYVYDKMPLVRNQISLSLALTCRIKTLNLETEVYGIIGGKQVINSLSVKVYNRWFADNDQNKVYFPIVVDTLEEAMLQVQWLRDNVKVKGFSITMPFKQELAIWLNSPEVMINTWLPESNTTANTDKYAMQRAVEELGLPELSKILILGRGAMAKLAMEVLAGQSFYIYQTNRRDDIRPIEHNETIPESFEALINCTPYGIAGTDNAELLPDFKALIDLPYGDNPTTLTLKALWNNIPCIDGIQFWKWQAMQQGKLFGFDADLLRSINEDNPAIGENPFILSS